MRRGGELEGPGHEARLALQWTLRRRTPDGLLQSGETSRTCLWMKRARRSEPGSASSPWGCPDVSGPGRASGPALSTHQGPGQLCLPSLPVRRAESCPFLL